MDHPELRHWRSTTVVVVVVVAPILAIGAATRDRAVWTMVAAVDGLLLAPVIFAACLMFYLAWRMRRRVEGAAIVVALACLGAQAVIVNVPLLDPATAHDSDLWSRLGAILTLVVVLGGLRLVPHARVDPLAVGLLAGTALGGLRLGIELAPLPGVTLAIGIDVALTLVALLLFGIVAVRLLRGTAVRQWLGGWVRLRLVVAAALLGVGQVGGIWADGLVGSLLCITANTAGCVLICIAALGLQQRTMTANQREFDQAYARLNVAEAETRAVQAHRHELNASLAAISAAHQLLARGPLLADNRRDSVAEMVDRELARLQRLSHGRLDPVAVSLAPPAKVALDDVIERVVLVHEVRGHRVEWQPSHGYVVADADDVTTVLNILLDNAAKHGATVSTVDVQLRGDRIEMEISDNGPGLAPGLGVEIFEWGVRGANSSGTGIGLSVARDLAQRYGGYLALRESDGSGTTFVLGLPSPRRGRTTKPGSGEGLHEPAHVS